MKLKIISLISTILVVIFLQSCSMEKLPKSVKLTKHDSVEISFADKGYQEVLFGTDLYGDWENLHMQKKGSLWTIKFQNPHKKIKYKFFIDGIFWKSDPLNNNKEKVPPPFAGYNSIAKFN